MIGARIDGALCSLFTLLSSSLVRAEETPAAVVEESFDYWIFDLGAGVPKLSSNKLRLSGELTFGYGRENFAISATGGGGFYDFASTSMISATVRRRIQSSGPAADMAETKPPKEWPTTASNGPNCRQAASIASTASGTVR